MSNVFDISTKPKSDKAVAVPEFSDDALALQMVNKYRGVIRYVPDLEGWFLWDGKCWRPDTKRQVFDFSREICRAAAATALNKPKTQNYARGLASAKTRYAVTSNSAIDQSIVMLACELDRDPLLLGTPDGVVDLRTGGLRPAKPEDYISKLTAVAPAPEGTPIPEFIKFLHSTFPKRDFSGPDDEVIGFVQRWAGYCCTGCNKEHKFLVAFGTGRNGKNTLLDQLFGILCNYAVEIPRRDYARARGSAASIRQAIDVDGDNRLRADALSVTRFYRQAVRAPREQKHSFCAILFPRPRIGTTIGTTTRLNHDGSCPRTVYLTRESTEEIDQMPILQQIRTRFGIGRDLPDSAALTQGLSEINKKIDKNRADTEALERELPTAVLKSIDNGATERRQLERLESEYRGLIATASAIKREIAAMQAHEQADDLAKRWKAALATVPAAVADANDITATIDTLVAQFDKLVATTGLIEESVPVLPGEFHRGHVPGKLIDALLRHLFVASEGRIGAFLETPHMMKTSGRGDIVAAVKDLAAYALREAPRDDADDHVDAAAIESAKESA